MIVFDLACADGHVFEAWFGSSDDFEDQKRRGLLACPLCGSQEVGKAVMAPAVGAKGNQLVSAGGAVAMRGGGGDMPDAARMKAMLHALAEAQAKALESSDYVGGRFAEEARAMHEGTRPERAIHGQASLAEARALIEDGVPVAPLPLPVRPPNSDN